MKNAIKLFDPSVGTGEKTSITQVLKSHFWASGSGTGNVLKFEEEFRKYVKADTCVAVNSGTSALNLALSLIDIKNKEVILPSLSFVSTAHAVVINGGKPVFVDVDPFTLCLDPDKIKKLRRDPEHHSTNRTPSAKRIAVPARHAGHARLVQLRQPRR